MKVIVTGGSGQLGTHILERCIGRRAIRQVVCLDVQPPSVVSPKLRFIRADVRDPRIGRHFDGANALIHLAFLFLQRRGRDEYESVNVRGSQNVFESAAEAGLDRVVYASSLAAYGIVPGHEVPITEDAPRRYQPRLAYAATKYRVEALLDAFEAEHPHIVVTRFRPGFLVGRRMPHVLGWLLEHRVMPDLGREPVPLAWDEDVADAFMLALDQEVRGAFNLAAAEPLRLSELADRGDLRFVPLPARVRRGIATVCRTAERFGLRPPIDPAWLFGLDVPMTPSCERARAVLGWEPTCPTSTDVIDRLRRRASGTIDPRLALFMRGVRLASRVLPPQPEAQRVQMAIHLDLTGPGGGDFTIRVDRGRIHVAPGTPRPPDAVLRMRVSAFLAMLSGQLDPTTADFTGKIRLQGEPVAKLVLGALVTMFRLTTERSGPAGWMARHFSDWIRAGSEPGARP